MDCDAGDGLPKGKGTRLRDIHEINKRLVRSGKELLKEIHFFIFAYHTGKHGSIYNLKQFRGFTFPQDSSSYDCKRRSLLRSTVTSLKQICALFDLNSGGKKTVLVMRLLDFLAKPMIEKTLTGQLKPKKKQASTVINPTETPTGIHICTFPPEILLRIFGFLNTKAKGRTARVCRQWHDVVYYPPLWRHSVAEWRLDQENPTLIPSLIERRVSKVKVLRDEDKFLMRLDISNPKELKLYGEPRCLKIVLEPFMNCLESLKALADKFTDDFLLDVIGNIPTLKKLEMHDCEQISNAGLQSYFRGERSKMRPALEDLLLNRVPNLSSESFRVLQMEIPTLKRLNVNNCWVNEESTKHIANMTQLEKLVLNDTRSFPRKWSHTSPLVYGKAKIATLKLINHEFLKDGRWNWLVRMPYLKKLCLSIYFISDLCLANLVSEKSTIDTLVLSGCPYITDEGLKCLSEMTELKELNLTNCYNISTTGLAYFANDSFRSTGLTIKCCQSIYFKFQPLFQEGVFRLISIRDEPKVIACSSKKNFFIKDRELFQAKFPFATIKVLGKLTK